MPASFVVEDGTGIANANSYISVADADQYFLDRGNATWAALGSTVKQECLVKATDYVDQRFGDRYIGTKYTTTQALEWPRDDTDFAVDEIPVKLTYAVAEYALRASAAPLAPDLQLNAAGVAMVTTSMKAGPVEQKFQSAAGTSAPAAVNILRPYPGADMFLRGLVVSAMRVIH